jgi:hypothetical protein
LQKEVQNTQTQTQNPNTQKIENLNPDLNLWVLLGAYVWVSVTNFPFLTPPVLTKIITSKTFSILEKKIGQN